ncbi:MAG TPA: tetratricopeptide repeat protein, partial [Thermoanaerobaculia bacterium]|nr:tetratricopeptide repeat protein [Thermoanaerobaculia bacterium]
TGSGGYPVPPSPQSFASNTTPSFVVDPAPPANPAGRGTAKAADFGFTFEEEKPADAGFASFSFDTPAEPAAAGFGFGTPAAEGGFSFDSGGRAPGAEFDFSTAAIDTSPDDQKKIEQYLTDGDLAFNAGDYQKSIDLWSRIFLIDVTNEQASERIEKAKAKRTDIERRVETLIADGVFAFDGGNPGEARTKFSEALRLDPGNVTAQEYIDRLGNTPATPAAGNASFFSPAADRGVDVDFFEEEPMEGGFEAPLIPPEPGAGPAPAATPAAAKKKKSGPVKKAKVSKPMPIGPILAVLAILVLGAGGWYAWTHFFNEPDTVAVASDQVFARASMLAKRGKYDEAIAALQEIKAGDPQHEQALRMISDFQQKKVSADELIDGKPAAQFYLDQISAAKTSYQAHDYDATKSAFEQAMRVKPLDAEAKGLYDLATQKVAALSTAKALFGERRYAEAIAGLQPLLAQDPENKNIQRMLTDAHFNLGAAALQDEKLPDAIREFDEVLKADPGDELAKRSKDLAARYDGQPKDLLYRIYVKYLPLRQAQ